MRRTSAGVLVVLALLSGAGGFLLDRALVEQGLRLQQQGMPLRRRQHRHAQAQLADAQ